MKKMVIAIFIIVSTFFIYNNCSGYSTSVSFGSSTNGSDSGSTAPPLSVTGNEPYVMPIMMASTQINLPIVTVKVCNPGTSQCVTVPNVLLDTGSYGLRIFASLISNIGLSQMVDSSGHHVAECVSYGDGSSDWGPVTLVNVSMGSETANNVPIQAIDSTFGNVPSDCTDLDTSPAAQGFNGILGVGLFAQDCGEACADTSNPDNEIYFDCAQTATNCQNSSVAVALAYQVTNPVSLLPIDNQGVIVQMPAIPAAGSPNPTGYLIFGIGTQAHNKPPAGVVTFDADENGNFQTTFNGSTYSTALIDSGSVGLYFPQTAQLPNCSSADDADWFCPSSTLTLTATQLSASGNVAATTSFSIANADVAFNTNNLAFNDIGAPLSDDFDWGFPFFFNRTIYVGLETKSSPLGVGPYWAY